MVSTRKKRQTNWRLLSQLDGCGQDVIFGTNARDRQENTIINEGCTGDQEFTVGISDNDSMTNENTVNVKTLEICFTENIDKEISIIVDTVADRIQNPFLTAIDSIVAPKI